MHYSSHFALGEEVKDEITGFRGIILAICYWLNGCVRITIQSRKMVSGKTVSETFDQESLERVGDGINIKQSKTGGHRPDQAQLSDPIRN